MTVTAPKSAAATEWWKAQRKRVLWTTVLALVAFAVIVLVARWLREWPAVQSFLETYPGIVPPPEGDFCQRGLRFGPHNTHENRPGSYRSAAAVVVLPSSG